VKEFNEVYGKLEESGRLFDVCFWQSRGPAAIFKAADRMVKDYLKLRGKNADEFRLQRTVESFRKI
jgi:hypothetical protein